MLRDEFPTIGTTINNPLNKLFNMKKMTLKQGVAYRGSAILNEYGQVQFTAYQQGTKPGNLHTVLETPFFRLSESRRMWQVKINFEKAEFSVGRAAERFAWVLSKLIAYVR